MTVKIYLEELRVQNLGKIEISEKMQTNGQKEYQKLPEEA